MNEPSTPLNALLDELADELETAKKLQAEAEAWAMRWTQPVNERIKALRTEIEARRVAESVPKSWLDHGAMTATEPVPTLTPEQTAELLTVARAVLDAWCEEQGNIAYVGLGAMQDLESVLREIGAPA